MPTVHAHHLQHCRFGGATRKPTRLMTVNMDDELTKELKRVERPRAPTGCLIGKNADGSWETSQAKEYPKAMSAGIASATGRAACKHQSIPPQADTEEDLEQFVHFSPQPLHTPETFGADFADSIAPVHRFLMQWSPPNIHSVYFFGVRLSVALSSMA